jgi:L-alanine-DL-glutamate epimerase-like enolase superfamily enzyme
VPQYIRLHARLGQTISTPVSGGESLFAHWDFADIFSKNAFSVVQPDAVHVGGITQCHAVATMADAWNIPCVPHVACSSVAGAGLAANLHVICAIENALYVEYDAYESPIRNDLFQEPIKARDGIVRVPERPGLGLELDPKAVAHYRLD